MDDSDGSQLGRRNAVANATDQNLTKMPPDELKDHLEEVQKSSGQSVCIDFHSFIIFFSKAAFLNTGENIAYNVI
jgi:hypothetical protein